MPLGRNLGVDQARRRCDRHLTWTSESIDIDFVENSGFTVLLAGV
jgi:hypothetical protein